MDDQAKRYPVARMRCSMAAISAALISVSADPKTKLDQSSPLAAKRCLTKSRTALCTASTSTERGAAPYRSVSPNIFVIADLHYLHYHHFVENIAGNAPSSVA